MLLCSRTSVLIVTIGNDNSIKAEQQSSNYSILLSAVILRDTSVAGSDGVVKKVNKCSLVFVTVGCKYNIL